MINEDIASNMFIQRYQFDYLVVSDRIKDSTHIKDTITIGKQFGRWTKNQGVRVGCIIVVHC